MVEDLQGFDAVSSFNRAMALGLKRYPQEFSVGGDVVNDEDVQGFGLSFASNAATCSGSLRVSMGLVM
jgi:hypothetical protein